MKKRQKTIITALAILTLCIPAAVFAVTPAHSVTFVKSSSQYARRTASNTGFPTGSSHKMAEGWIKFTSLPGTNVIYTFIETGSDTGVGSDNTGWGLSVKNVSGNIVCYEDVYDRAIIGSVDLGVSTGVWYHYAEVYDGTNLLCYIGTAGSNDVLKDTISAGTISADSATVGIGGRIINLAYGEYADGQLSLARFWKTNNNLTTINTDRCLELGATTNLSAEWLLDNDYTDNSGNGNTLTAGAGGNAPSFGTDVPCGSASTPFDFGRLFPF